MRHYDPRFVYFYPIFWCPFLCFQWRNFRKFCPYVWLVFKSGFKSRVGYSGRCVRYINCRWERRQSLFIVLDTNLWEERTQVVAVVGYLAFKTVHIPSNAKGHLVSLCPFDVIVLTKIPSKFLKDFSLRGQIEKSS